LLIQRRTLEALVDADLDTLATALYVRIDDWLKSQPQWAPWRPAIGIAPELSDAEALTLAVLQALLGHVSEARWLRVARRQRRHLFPYLPQQPGYNKRLRKLAGTMNWLIGMLARDTTLWTDDVWVVDSTPVECGRSKETARRSDLAGWAEYGYCASHSRWFWGLRSPVSSAKLKVSRREPKGGLPALPGAGPWVRGQPAGPHSIWFCRSRRAAVA
jgi:hypothetical protein